MYRRIKLAGELGCLAVGMDIDHAFAYGRCRYDEVDGLEMYPVASAELAGFVKAADIPFVVKGVLSRQDARKCLDAGVSGILVSHHNGRLEYAAPPLMVLPDILDEVGGRIPVFVDCSVSSGTDVFKALALGASACCVGRPLMQSLSSGGAAAVAEHIGNISQQLAYAMAMTCSPDLGHIDRGVIRPAAFSW